jgi:hypothetical protein
MSSPHLTVTDAVEKVDPWRNASLQPGFGGPGNTWCNRFAKLVCDELGATLGGILANEQAEWLRTADAVSCGWVPCGELTARKWCAGGGLALATWQNPTGKHGHIAVLVPALPGAPPSFTYIAQAGARNFAHEPLARGFGTLPVEFHIHSPARVCAPTP